jgi:tetratricopeptide (TPR) repeat protein
MSQDRRAAAPELFARSLMINPNSVMALTLGGWIEIMRGNQGAGRTMIERAQRLSPRDPRGWFASGAMAVAAIADENYLEAIQWAEKALTRNRRFAVALRVLIVALAKLDQKDRAGTIARELLEVEPELTISGFFERIPFPRDTMATTYAEALRAAGVPE